MKKDKKIKKKRESGIQEQIIISYEQIKETYESNGCKLLTTEEEFNVLKKKTKISYAEFKIESSCGHITINSNYYSFKNRKTGLICKDCAYQNLKII